MMMIKLISCLFYTSLMSHWGRIGEVFFVCGSCARSQADKAATMWNIAGHKQRGERDLWMAAHQQ